MVQFSVNLLSVFPRYENVATLLFAQNSISLLHINEHIMNIS